MKKFFKDVYDYIAYITQPKFITLLATFCRLYCYFLGIRRIIDRDYVNGIIIFSIQLLMGILNIFFFFNVIRKNKPNIYKKADRDFRNKFDLLRDNEKINISLFTKKELSKKDELEIEEHFAGLLNEMLNETYERIDKLKDEIKGDNNNGSN